MGLFGRNGSSLPLVGPKQSGTIQVAQAAGETRDIGKIFRFMHDKDTERWYYDLTAEQRRGIQERMPY